MMTAPVSPTAMQTSTRGPVHLYYPAEGFGNVYRRVLTNDFFTRLVRTSKIRSVAELPLDSYGIVGAGSLIFSQLGCDTTLIGDDNVVLDRARLLMGSNGIENVRYLYYSDLEHLDLPRDAFDFTWSFDRLQVMANPDGFLSELCRVSKATMIMVPNAYNYGQFAHHVYHRRTGTTCDYVGPRSWMRRAPIEDALRRHGLAVLDWGCIDVPWWPEFPELPNLVRRVLGRAPLELDGNSTPEVDPQVIPESEVPQLRRLVHRSAFIELGPWPRFAKLPFAHNIYVIACKLRYLRELGL